MAGNRATARTADIQSPSGLDAATVQAELNAKVNIRRNAKMMVAGVYKDEKRIKVTGSPMYVPYFGKKMPISLNGISIYVPLDGQSYEIPESFAAIFLDRISRVDEQERIRKSLSNVKENSEAFAGEKELIRRA